MTKLSVNVNKIATLRNARGGNVPDLLRVVEDCQSFGAQGITVHPRPDERHIRYQDVRDMRSLITTELNIEGNPTDSFMALVEEVRPHQVTLVPDAPDALTSSAGWQVRKHRSFLTEIVAQLKAWGIRSSIFVETQESDILGAAEIGADRVELYTEPYATRYVTCREEAIAPFVKAAQIAQEAGLGLNAGHDLSLDNLSYLTNSIPYLLEVSIGHALISEALYLGLEPTIHRYLSILSGVPS